MFIEKDSHNKSQGWIEVVCGSMFSGKTEELIRRLKRAKIAKLKVEIFKPGVDTRYSEEDVVSHDATALHSIPVESAQEILFYANDVDVIGIDEAQFLDDELPNVCQHVFPQEYLDLRKKLDAIRATQVNVPKVPCHCDYQPTNLVISADKLYVLDWEFAGMNDPFYDIACYGNVGFDKALALLEAYVGHKPTKEELQRLYFHRAFQCLQWFNVAIFKDRVGLSKDLNMDFNAVAFMFLGMAKDLLENYNNL